MVCTVHTIRNYPQQCNIKRACKQLQQSITGRLGSDQTLGLHMIDFSGPCSFFPEYLPMIFGSHPCSCSQGPSSAIEQELNLPSLEGGRRASEVILPYMKGLLARSSKLADVLNKFTDLVPEKDRTDGNVK